jgi:outer membrane protein TolC
MKLPLLLLLPTAVLSGQQTHALSLRQILDTASRQNPDLLMARLDLQAAESNIAIQRDPFFPKVYAGSGAAYTNGFPMSIDGAAPSVIRAQGVATIFNRPQSYRLALAREEAAGASHALSARREQILAETVNLCLEADRAARSAAMAARQADSAQKVFEIVRQRVLDGRELPLEEKKARLEILRAQRLVESFRLQQESAESSLASLLGYPPGDRVRPVLEERPFAALPESQREAFEAALKNSPEIRRLESAVAAGQLSIQAARAERLPRLDLVAQYSLLSRFNNFEDFFQRFQRNNAQLGMSLQIPVFAGTAVAAQVRQAEARLEKARLALQALRSSVVLETRKAWLSMRDAESARQFARLDLEVARENLDVVLARFEEGRAGLRDVEGARLEESAKWLQYYQAQHAFEQAQINLLLRTGGLVSALR